jgi:nicotinamide phosphoribosyltransferase
LHERVGLIYGDSITLERAQVILEQLKAKGFASSNIVLGIGSFTYQYMTRDSFGFAMKATWGQVDGQGRSIFKDPITDSRLKKSAKGLLRVEAVSDGYVLYDEQTPEQEQQGALKTLFEDGRLVRDDTLDNIQARLT